MAEFSKSEKQILKYIPPQNRLRTNLTDLREAVEIIWDIEAPRVIQDFTDHGIRHYERLADYAAQLLKANQGRKLSKEEAYLLLAGIYVHDIGMQCDVVKFPDIKDRAVELGATFQIDEFEAKTTNTYSYDEQKDIRKNHHWLSIAWIDVAKKSPDNVLHKAANGIPNELVLDLKDVAVHHTKLPITSCPVAFKLDPNGRKQFVAALLRFADELDIQSNRVNIDTVNAFSLNPENCVYWWLHHLTKVTFPTESLLNVSLTLHPADFDEFHNIIQEVFINEFRTKNSSVLSVLAKNQVPVVMDEESKVTEYEYADRLPDIIRSTLQHLSQPNHADPLSDLADEVRLWLRAIRYEVGHAHTIDGSIAEMIATMETGTIKQSVLIRCVGRPIKESDVRELDKDLSRKTNQGWLISDRSVSDDVRNALEEYRDVEVYRLREFLEQRVWGPYIESLNSLVNNQRIPELYVDIGCYRQPFSEKSDDSKREPYESLDEAVDEWLAARDKMHVSLLGEFGSGKTWFCRHYAFRQLQKYLQNPAKERFPLLITLRNFTKASTAKELITHAIVEQYQLSFVGDPFVIFDELNRRGKILLILDGFDEMARRVDKQTMVDNFLELAELVNDNSKVILTSRTEYFRWAKEAEAVLGGDEYGRQIPVLQPPKFDVLYLEPFTNDQIRQVILGRIDTDGEKVADKLLGNDNLREMARKPVLIELLLAAAEEQDADLLTNQAAVYLYATNQLLLRNIKEERTFTSTSDKLLFLCELAWKMIDSGEHRIHYKDIPERIQEHFADQIKGGSDLDHWDYDLRNQTLLRPDLQGYYEFSHKSLAEFFVALKFTAELGWLSDVFAETYEEESGKSSQLPFEKLSTVELARGFGAKNIGTNEFLPIRMFMHQMIRREKGLTDELLELKGQQDLRDTTANVATLLSDLGILKEANELTDLDLGGAVLWSSQIKDKMVEGCRFGHTTIYVDDTVDPSDIRIGYGTIIGTPFIIGFANHESPGVVRIFKSIGRFLPVHTTVNEIDTLLGAAWKRGPRAHSTNHANAPIKVDEFIRTALNQLTIEWKGTPRLHSAFRAVRRSLDRILGQNKFKLADSYKLIG